MVKNKEGKIFLDGEYIVKEKDSCTVSALSSDVSSSSLTNVLIIWA